MTTRQNARGGPRRPVFPGAGGRIVPVRAGGDRVAFEGEPGNDRAFALRALRGDGVRIRTAFAGSV